MYKVTVLCSHPPDPKAFEKYYAETHIPLAMSIKKLIHVETTKFIDAQGIKPAYYRVGEPCFATADDMQESLASAEGQATTNDLTNFASGGFTFLFGTYETLI